MILQNVNAEHPPDQKQRDKRNNEVTNPLAGGSRFRAVIHGLIVAGWVAVKWAGDGQQARRIERILDFIRSTARFYDF